MPILLKYKTDFQTWRPYIAFGPELGLKIGADGVYRVGGQPDEIEGFEDQVLSRDFAFDFGGGLEIPTGPLSFLIEGLYSLGLKNLNSVPETDGPENVKTRTFMLNVGVRFSRPPR